MIKNLQEYTGVIHIHTRYSDGTGKVEDIISTAQNAGLDFIIITDHNHMKAKKAGAEGWYGKDRKSLNKKNHNLGLNNSHPVLVLVGQEITKREGDCLALNVNPDGLNRKKAHGYIPEIRKRGGLTFICHPHFDAKPQFAIDDSSWKRWDLFKSENSDDLWPDGIELWSHLGDWAEKLSWGTIISHVNNPDSFIEGPDDRTIKIWNELTQNRSLVAFGGADAHAKSFLPFGLYTSITYLESFQAVRTHIYSEPFTGDFDQDAELVYRSLSLGHCFIGYDRLADSTGFKFKALNNEGQISAMMGDTIQHNPNETINLRIDSPSKESQIRLIYQGKLLKESNTSSLIHPVSTKGVYRVEVHYKNRPWIYSNPIYIR